MDYELKQRLIGAVVVTALATIFIPMLLDDPVDNSGQVVSELNIPQTPSNPVVTSANKLPTQADTSIKQRAGVKPQNPPVAETEKVIETEEEAELSATPETVAAKVPEEQPVSEIGGDPNVADEADEAAASSLDTGVVAEAEPAKNNAKAAHAKPVEPPPEPEPIASDPELTKLNKSSEHSRWSIQAGSFSKKDNALALQESLRKQGLPAVVETLKGSKGPIYRLKVGPSLDKKRAAQMKSVLDKQNIQSLIIAE